MLSSQKQVSTTSESSEAEMEFSEDDKVKESGEEMEETEESEDEMEETEESEDEIAEDNNDPDWSVLDEIGEENRYDDEENDDETNTYIRCVCVCGGGGMEQNSREMTLAHMSLHFTGLKRTPLVRTNQSSLYFIHGCWHCFPCSVSIARKAIPTSE